MGDDYDIFISYRRDGGSGTARLIQSEFEARGFRVFLDVDGLKTGHFDNALLRHIEHARVFLVVLSKGSLDRCAAEDDWLRTEIVHALKTRRKIIPVVMPDFSFPPASSMPESMRELNRHNAVTYSHEYFADMVERISEYVGKPKRSITCFKAVGWSVAAVLVAALTTWGLRHGEDHPLPDAAEPAGIGLVVASELVDQVQRVDEHLMSLSYIWNAPARGRVLEIWKAGSVNQNPRSRKTLMGIYCDNIIDTLQIEFGNNRLDKQVPPSLTSLAQRDPDMYEELQSCYRQLRALASREQAVIDRVKALKECGDLKAVEQQSQSVQNAVETVELQAELVYLKALVLLDGMATDSQSRAGITAMLSQLSRLSPKGLVPQKDALARIEQILNQRKRLGEAKRDDVQVARERLVEMDFKLAEGYESIRKKCALSAEDDPEIMWGKIIRLMSVGMYDDVEKQLSRYLEFDAAGADTGLFVNVARAYVAEARRTGINHGVLVFAIENDAPHSSLRKGDIVTELNGQRVMGATSYIEIKKQSGGAVKNYRYLRLSSSGKLVEHHALGDADDPRIGVMDMTEQL